MSFLNFFNGTFWRKKNCAVKEFILYVMNWLCYDFIHKTMNKPKIGEICIEWQKHVKLDSYHLMWLIQFSPIFGIQLCKLKKKEDLIYKTGF